MIDSNEKQYDNDDEIKLSELFFIIWERNFFIIDSVKLVTFGSICNH